MARRLPIPAALIAIAVVLTLTGGLRPATAADAAGSVDPGFAQSTAGMTGTVTAVVPVADGRFLVAGRFSAYRGSPNPGLVRVNPDGSPDAGFRQSGSGLDGSVTAIAVQPDGRILAAGAFTSYDGTAAPRVIRLNPDGSRDTTFTQTGTGLNGEANAVALQPDGKIVVGGEFTTYNGAPAQRVLRLNADGTRDPGFTQTGTGLNEDVNAVAVRSDGKIVAGGVFTAYNGAAAPRVIRLNADGTRDPAFLQAGTGLSGEVKTVIALPGGKTMVGGAFATYNGLPAPRLARLGANGSLDTSFSPAGTGLNATVWSLVQQPDGQFVAGGDFTDYNGDAARRLIRLDADGVRDNTFGTAGTGFNNPVMAIAVQPDGRVVAGGNFTKYDTAMVRYFLRLDPVGGLDTSFVTYGSGLDASALSLALQPDGRILVGGLSTAHGATPVARLIRLNPDGSRDTGFTLDGTGLNGAVYSIAVQPDGRILAAGDFTTYNGAMARGLIRLNPDGTRDTSFVTGTGFDNDVAVVALQSDGRIYAGGGFSSYNGVPSLGIIRLNANGGHDPSFAQTGTGIDNAAVTIQVQPDGRILAGGYFTAYNGSAAPYLIRFNADGTRDSSFAHTGTGLNAAVVALALQPDGKVIAGGPFATYNGAAAPRLIRFNADGTRDASFTQTGTGPDGKVSTLALQADGKLLVGGSFTAYNAAPAQRLVRVNPDGSQDGGFAQTGLGLNGDVEAVVQQPDGRIVAGGEFTLYDAAPYAFVTRILDRASPAPSPTPTPTPSPNRPAKPKGLRVKTSPTKIAAKWKAVSAATAYTAKVTGKNRKSKKVTKKRTVTKAKVAFGIKLKPRSKAKVCVTARNAAGSSAARCVTKKVPRRK